MNDAPLGLHLSDRYRDALVLAFDLHRTQLRKDSGVPYVAHLLGVSSLALEYGASEDLAIAALLHDAVEDQGGLATLERIRATFGEGVAAVVLACSDSHDGTVKLPWRARKENYIAHLQAAPADVQLVAACDKLYNLRAILADYRLLGEALWQRFSGKREGVLWYYQTLAYQGFAAENPVRDELQRTLATLLELAGEPALARTPDNA